MRRLLLVDDARDIRTIAQLSLERVGGWSVVALASGREAVETVRAEEGPFDAVLLDVMMPGLDGPATLELLKEIPRMRDVPVFFLTAKAQTDGERLESLGAAGVIAKPFDPLTLPSQLSRLLPPNGPTGSSPVDGRRRCPPARTHVEAGGA